MRLTPEREKEIREWIKINYHEYAYRPATGGAIKELLAEIDALREELKLAYRDIDTLQGY